MGRVAPRVSGALVGWIAFVVVFASLQYVGQFLAEPPPDDLAYRWETSVVAAVTSGAMLAIVLLLTRGRGVRRMLALRAPSSWRTALWIGAVVIGAVLAVSAALSPIASPEEEQGLVPTFWDPDRAPQFVAFALAVTVVAPIVEEAMFRGAGYWLLEPFGRTTAILVVGLAFALVHGLVLGFPIIAAFGIGLAYLRSRTGSLYPCVLLHAAFNTTALLLGVAT